MPPWLWHPSYFCWREKVYPYILLTKQRKIKQRVRRSDWVNKSSKKIYFHRSNFFDIFFFGPTQTVIHQSTTVSFMAQCWKSMHECQCKKKTWIAVMKKFKLLHISTCKWLQQNGVHQSNVSHIPFPYRGICFLFRNFFVVFRSVPENIYVLYWATNEKTCTEILCMHKFAGRL